MIRLIAVVSFWIWLPAIGANIVPSNLPADYCDGAATGDLVVGAGVVTAINTDTDCDSVLVQSSGPDLCLVSRNSVTVAATGLINVTGSRPLVLTALQNFSLTGDIHAAAASNTAGSGSVAFGDGVAAGSSSVGGGGAGHRDVGGKGGNSGGAGGPSYAQNSVVPLLGGSAGGPGGAGGLVATAPGGGGGGAMQLVACQQFLLGGMASAGGGGGGGGAGVTSASSPLGGAGGGSGGTILVEGDDVSISGYICANGGGGGGGGTKGPSTVVAGVPGQSGADAHCTQTPALGGTAAIPAGSGGSGGAAALPPGPGSNASSGGGAGGGGGGAVGTIGIHSCSSQTINGIAVLSPSPSSGSNCSHIFIDGFDGV